MHDIDIDLGLGFDEFLYSLLYFFSPGPTFH